MISIFFIIVLTTTYSCFDRTGLDLVNGVIRDSKKDGVLEPVVCKVKCLKFATEAAITILRIDDMIKLEKRQEEPAGRSYQDAVRGGHL